MNETEYRQRIYETMGRIEKALEDVDPDLVECEQAQGAMTLTFADRTKCILSAQPSVRQLWLALASLGTAYHFNWDPKASKWRDDKGRDVELLSFLEGFLKEKAAINVRLS